MEESDDNDDQVDPATITEARIHSGVVDKLITVIVAFLLKFRIVYNISNRAIVLLLRFFKYLLLLIGQSFRIPSLSSEIYLPQSIPGCYSYLQLNSTPYKEYTVCPTCHMLYDQGTQTLVTRTGTSYQSVACSFVEFPNHPQRRFRLPCNTVLLHNVRCRKEQVFRPRKIYYYYGLKAALCALVKRPNFLNSCNLWLKKNCADMMGDITDGKCGKNLCVLCHLVGSQSIFWDC